MASEVMYNWFKSYLTNRSQYVAYNNAKSQTKIRTHGIHQRSILGILLLIIYMNDFSRSSKRLFSILFADDTNVLKSVYNMYLLRSTHKVNSCVLKCYISNLINDYTNYMSCRCIVISINSIIIIALNKLSTSITCIIT